MRQACVAANDVELGDIQGYITTDPNEQHPILFNDIHVQKGSTKAEDMLDILYERYEKLHFPW